jgi:hypothetical protein
MVRGFPTLRYELRSNGNPNPNFYEWNIDRIYSARCILKNLTGRSSFTSTGDRRNFRETGHIQRTIVSLVCDGFEIKTTGLGEVD